jgi:hypothetical protein
LPPDSSPLETSLLALLIHGTVGWALPRPVLYMCEFFSKRKISVADFSLCKLHKSKKK